MATHDTGHAFRIASTARLLQRNLISAFGPMRDVLTQTSLWRPVAAT